MDKMKIKIDTVLDSNFITPFSSFCTYSLPAKAAYLLSNCVKVVNDTATEARSKKDAVLVRYAVDGKIPPENEANALQEIKELAETEIDLPISEKVKISFAKLDELKIHPTTFEIGAASLFVEFVD